MDDYFLLDLDEAICGLHRAVANLEDVVMNQFFDTGGEEPFEAKTFMDNITALRHMLKDVVPQSTTQILEEAKKRWETRHSLVNPLLLHGNP